MSFQRILVPTDFSSHAQHAALVAGDMAQRYDAELTLLHVQSAELFDVPEGYVLNMPAQLDQLMKVLAERLAAFQQAMRANGLRRVETRLLRGPIAGEIVAHAKEFDLIVMGTHGRTGLQHLLMGSVAERVVRLAHCAVLVVRAPATANAGVPA